MASEPTRSCPWISKTRPAARAGWYCLGDYDVILIFNLPNIESMAAIAVAIAAGGAIKSSHTTALMTGTELVAALKKSEAVVKNYKPAR